MPRIGIYAGVPLVVLCVLACAAPAAAWPSHWLPPQRLTWYWQLQGSVKVEPVTATDMDGFDNSAATVARFHALGQKVICYIDVGTAEDFRSDDSAFPASVLGQTNGWPGEKWLDIRQLSILEPIITARFRMCAQKGFDAVEPDNIDGYENGTGFPITAAQQLTYDEWIANEVHSLGMAVFQKNDLDQATQLQPYFDGALDEQCNQYSECSSFQPYLSAGKPALNAEYQSSTYPGFCGADNKLGIMGALYNLDLDGATYQPCFGPSVAAPATGPSPTSPPTPPTPRRKAPNPAVGIGAARLTDHRGEIALRLSCPARESYCAGALELDSVRRFPAAHAAKRQGRLIALVFGTHRFHITGGHSSAVSVKVSRQALRRFGTAHRIGLVATTTARDRAGRHAKTRRTLMLTLR
jgi:hypothetical protein